MPNITSKVGKHHSPQISRILYLFSFLQGDSFGLLLACFYDSRSRASYSLIRLLQKVDSFGVIVNNEFDCPLLTLTDLVYLIESISIHYAVSVVHECNNSCTYVTSSVTTVIERETITKSVLSFKHDPSNRMYCLNIYCMSH